MSKVTSKNNDLLRDSKQKVSPKIYGLLLDLVNDNREDLAELVLKVDYLIEYANRAIKGRDNDEAVDSMHKAEERIKMLKREGVDITHIEYLLEGVKKKIRK
jgi:tRNA U34 5-carboxymethylaminomethyl modifying GTPase MnmE/TrmE